ncbi:hypothetical protein [Brevibacillus brevis]|uniref:Transcriptional regulator n=1 Tax=Brevibacillus brevis TaxID=1393 RepID=A0ABY9SXB5_BREBE|nr:hypothetical protein [Brevibacillus brevis]WNC12244.1 hypothetical protein RGB73_16005 [Brevibacillus brevis]
MLKTIMVPVNKRLKRVPVLTPVHLKAFNMLVNGAEVSAVVADRRLRKAVNDLYRLGWVRAREDRRA